VRIIIPPSVVNPDAYLEGRAAYPQFGICQNPYHSNLLEYLDWEHGWDDAQCEDDRRAGI